MDCLCGLPAVIAGSVTIINATRCLILWEGDDVVQIPTSALFRYRDRWGLITRSEYERRKDGISRRSLIH